MTGPLTDRPADTSPLPALAPVLALDIGGTSMRAALVQGGRVLERVEARTPRPATPEAVIAAGRKVMREGE